MGMKKNDHEARRSHPAEVKQQFRVLLRSSVGRMFYANWMSCDAWGDVQLPSGWHISKEQVPIQPVPHSGP
jgi:hypothetical protein